MDTMTFTASAENMPAYPCDVCEDHVEAGERVHVADGGLTVEHVACASNWRRANFGREILS
jgi:hypothetical protein